MLITPTRYRPWLRLAGWRLPATGVIVGAPCSAPPRTPSHHRREASVIAVSTVAARITTLAVLAFVGLLVALHRLEPEYDPSWRLISEYSLGRYGVLMQAAFVSLGVGALTLIVATWRYTRTGFGRLGRLGLLFVGAGLCLAAVFTTDPITGTASGRPTPTGLAHDACAFVVILGLPVTASLLGHVLFRDPAWSGARTWLAFLTLLVWVGLGLFIASIVVAGRVGQPDAHVGWPNRLLMATYCLWLLAVSLGAVRAGRKARSKAATGAA